jgi:outer membrane protein
MPSPGRHALLCACLSYAFASSAARAITLEEAWVLAYANNPSLEAQRAALRATDEQVAQALNNWRPSIDATASAGRTYQYTPELAPFENPNFSGTERSYGAQIKQPLFRGFRTVAATDAAEKQVLAGRAKLESAEQQLFLDTASAYLGVLRDQAVLELQRHHDAVLQDKLRETQARAKAGELTQTDVRQAELRLARAQANRYQAQSILAQDRAAYQRLVGTEAGVLLTPAPSAGPPPLLADILQAAESRNPDVVSARYAVEQADAQIRLAKGSLLPEVDLVGTTTRGYAQDISLPGREDSSQMLVQLTVPLYRSGADYATARAAQQTASQRRDELDEARHRAHEAAQNAWSTLSAAQSALDADAAEVNAARDALAGVTAESKVGTRTTLDVLNAEQELLDAQTDEVRSRRDRDFAALQIKASAGGLTSASLKLPIEPYDPKRHYQDVRDQWAGFSAGDARYRVLPAPASH